MKWGTNWLRSSLWLIPCNNCRGLLKKGAESTHVNPQSNFRRVWQKLTSAAPEGKTFRRQPGESKPRIGAITDTRRLRSSPFELAVKTTDPLVRLLTLVSRSLLP